MAMQVVHLAGCAARLAYRITPLSVVLQASCMAAAHACYQALSEIELFVEHLLLPANPAPILGKSGQLACAGCRSHPHDANIQVTRTWTIPDSDHIRGRRAM